MLPQRSDEEWGELLKPANIDKSRKAAEQEYKKLTQTDIDYLRKRCVTDLFFLGYAILGYTRMSPNLHGNLANWLERTQLEQFRLIMMPRAHFKTSEATITDAIQCVLPNPEAPWPRGLGTNCRVLYGHESHEGATRFLFETTRHFCNNPLLMGLFPELVPNPRTQRMNKFELELPRDQHWGEPTFDTIGVGGHSQGRHYNLIKLDDIFGDKARDSKAERETTIQWFDNIQSFFVRLKHDHLDMIGTRYSLDDVYAHAIKTYGKRMLKYIRRIREPNAKTGELEYIFPEEFDDQAVEILRKNAKVWAAQYVNDPHEGLAEWDAKWKRYYYWTGKGKLSAFTGTTQVAPLTVNVKDLDILILIDPATTGKRGIVVTGVDEKGRVFILQAIKEPIKLAEQATEIFALVQKWWPRAVIIEEVVFSALYKVWFETEMKLRKLYFNIIPVSPKKVNSTLDKSKMGRVRALSQWFSAGQIFFNEGQAELIEEFDNFGATDDYHILDALAYGPDCWRSGVSQTKRDKDRAEENQLIEDRDPQTGYST